MRRPRSVVTFALAGLLGLSAHAAAETAVFTDAFELKIQNNSQNNVPLPSVQGSSVSNYFLDGGNPVAGNPNTGPGDSGHAYDFIRFENMFGSGLGQIPAGATILGAKLTVTTSTVSNAQSNGPFGVAPLLAPFAASNVYADYTGANTGYDAGPSYLNGYVGRPAGGFSGMTVDKIGQKTSADVTLLLQQWATAPSTAYGFAVTPRTTDGWSYETVGSPTVENRPTLTVEYTTAPTTFHRFQEGMNGYTGTTMSQITSQGQVAGEVGTIPAKNGATLNGSYLDGPNGTDSYDVQAMLKFDNIFGNLEGQVKSGENILRAYLVLTTVANGESHTGGSYDVHRVLTDWDTTMNFASFGADGPSVADGEITNPLSSANGMIQGSRALFDVTSAVQAWQSGASNFGFNVQSNTTDGWQLYWNGALDASVRPELIVVTGVPEPSAAMVLCSAGAGLIGFRRRRS